MCDTWKISFHRKHLLVKQCILKVVPEKLTYQNKMLKIRKKVVVEPNSIKKQEIHRNEISSHSFELNFVRPHSIKYNQSKKPERNKQNPKLIKQVNCCFTVKHHYQSSFN